MSNSSRMPCEQQIFLLFTRLNERRREHCLSMLARYHQDMRAGEAARRVERSEGSAPTLWASEEK